MKLLGIFTKKKKQEKKFDVYQESVEKVGRDQLLKIAKRDLHIRVTAL